MNIEKIKFGNHIFDLVPNGVKLDETGGEISFQKGEKTSDEIKGILKSNSEITLLGITGNLLWNREDLVYAKRIEEQEDAILFSENVQIGVNEDNEPIYNQTDVRGDVVTAKFRTPDLRDEIATLNARVAYLSMMSEIDFGEVQS